MRIQSEKMKSEANLQAQNAQLKGEIATRGGQLKEKNKNLSRCELESTQLMSELESTKNSMNKKVENLLAKNNSLNKKLDEAKEALKKVKNEEKRAKKKKFKNIQVQTHEPLYSNAGAPCVCGRPSGGSSKTEPNHSVTDTASVIDVVDGEPPAGNCHDKTNNIPDEMKSLAKSEGGDNDNNSNPTKELKNIPDEMKSLANSEEGDNDNNNDLTEELKNIPDVLESMENSEEGVNEKETPILSIDDPQIDPTKSLPDPQTIPNVAADETSKMLFLMYSKLSRLNNKLEIQLDTAQASHSKHTHFEK